MVIDARRASPTRRDSTGLVLLASARSHRTELSNGGGDSLDESQLSEQICRQRSGVEWRHEGGMIKRARRQCSC